MAKRRWHRVITMLLAGVCGCLCSCGTPSAAVTEEVTTVMHLPYLEQTYAQLHLPSVQEPVVATWLPYFLYPELFGSGTEEQARAAVREMLSDFADNINISLQALLGFHPFETSADFNLKISVAENLAVITAVFYDAFNAAGGSVGADVVHIDGAVIALDDVKAGI